MPRWIKIAGIAGMVFFLSACGIKGGGKSPLVFKRITPAMEMEMEGLIQAGCDQEYEYFDRDVALLYSLLPGGGQWYTGETRKAWIYLMSFPLVIPYIVSFQDAQNSVDYYNFRYTAHFCKNKLKVTDATPLPAKGLHKKVSKENKKKRMRKKTGRDKF
jgi:hypothetical protein